MQEQKDISEVLPFTSEWPGQDSRKHGNFLYRHETDNTQSGFILITTLMVMQILTLAVWIMLVNACQSLKISRQLPLSHAMFVHAEMALEEAERRVLKGQLYPRYSGILKEGVYTCRTELLGVDPCMILSGTNRTGEYIRVTLEWRESLSELPVILQTVLLKSAAATGKCHGNSRSMPEGRIAWREMDIS